MGQAREVLDRITAAVLRGDEAGLAALYAPDAVAETPDEGDIHGREAIAKYLVAFTRAFPDAYFEELRGYEDGDTAIDEGYFCGTHTGPIAMPDGSEVPPTGRKVRLRECDILVVEGGLATSHRFYFDQMAFLVQLGLMEGEAATLPSPRVSAASETASAQGSARA